MPRIEWVEDDDAVGELAEIYSAWRAVNPGRSFPQILKCMSARPEMLRGIMQISDAVHFSDGHLTYRTKELIATYVSAINKCRY